MLARETATDVELALYQPIGYPLVLRSKKDNRYLASVHIMDALAPHIKPIISGLPNSGGRYQIIFGKDDTNVCIVLTNFCHEGYVKLDLMRDDRFINEVDPGGINQTNEVRPYQSYEIKADFTNQNRQIIVSKKKTSSGEHVKLEDDEKKPAGEKVGDYIYLTVTPRNGVPAFIDYFKETYWVVPDYIIVHSPKRVAMNESYGRLLPTGALPSGFATSARSLVSSRGVVQRGGLESAILSDSSIIQTEESKSDYYCKPECCIVGESEESVGGSGGGLFGGDDDDLDDCAFDMTKSIKSVKTTTTPELDNAYRGMTLKSPDSCEIMKSKGKTERSLSRGIVETSPPLITPVSATKLADIVVPTAVNTSHVAGIRHGEKLNVHVFNTGVNYLYDLHSPKCVLGMSIIDDLVVGPPAQIDVLEATGVLKEYAERLNKKIFEDIKVFDQENCVVCLEEKVNIVLLRCGHLCACSMECAGPFDKCPICRTKIVHKMDKSKLVSCI
jgi:hypothetical protein